jgi:WG containing repeat
VAAACLSVCPLPAMAGSGNGLHFPMLVNIGGKCGFIDAKGSVVIAPKFTRADSFDSNGRAIVRLGKKYGLIDTTGKAILPFSYDEISESGEAGLFKVTKDMKSGYADKAGKVVIPLIYDEVGDFGMAGLVKVKSGDVQSILDTKGSLIFEVPYGAYMADFGDSQITAFSPDQGGKTGFVDRKGTFVLPPIWDNAFGFGDGPIAPVEQDGKWGFIDKAGKVIVEPVYDYALSSYAGKSSVFVGDELRDVDAQGKLLPQSEMPGGYTVETFNARGFAAAWKEISKYKWQYGIVDKELNWVLQPTFDNIDIDEDQEFYAAQQGTKAGYINLKGQFVMASNFTDTTGFDGTDRAIAYQGKNGGVIDRSGKWVLPPKFKALGYCKPPEPPKLVPPPIINTPEVYNAPSVPDTRSD